LYLILCTYVFISLNNDTYKHLKTSRDKQHEFKVIFHSIEESLLIIQDGAIHFANDHFLTHFQAVIELFRAAKRDTPFETILY